MQIVKARAILARTQGNHTVLAQQLIKVVPDIWINYYLVYHNLLNEMIIPISFLMADGNNNIISVFKFSEIKSPFVKSFCYTFFK